MAGPKTSKHFAGDEHSRFTLRRRGGGLNGPQAGRRAVLSPAGQAELTRRAGILEEVNRLVKRGKSKSAAARAVRISIITLWRWQNAFKSGGMAGLAPGYYRCGRRPAFKPAKLSAKAQAEIEALVLKHGSQRAGWRQFAGSAVCPPAVAEFIRQHGTAPESMAGLAKLRALPTTVFLSADERRIYVRLTKGAKT